MYKKNNFSMGQAAKFANMYIGDFMELMAERGVENNLTLEMVKKSKHSRAKKNRQTARRLGVAFLLAPIGAK